MRMDTHKAHEMKYSCDHKYNCPDHQKGKEKKHLKTKQVSSFFSAFPYSIRLLSCLCLINPSKPNSGICTSKRPILIEQIHNTNLIHRYLQLSHVHLYWNLNLIFLFNYKVDRLYYPSLGLFSLLLKCSLFRLVLCNNLRLMFCWHFQTNSN